MASLMEIRSNMMAELREHGYDSVQLDHFAQEFNRNLRYQTNSLRITTDVELEEVYAWVDEVNHAYESCIRIGGCAIRRRYHK